MNQKLKIIVAHPGQQHSYQLATALKQQECLYQYITTYYAYKDKKNFFSKLRLPSNYALRASNRRCEALEDAEVKTYCTVGFFLVAFLLRFDKKGNLYRKVNRWLSYSFGRKIARFAIKHNVDAVVLYDTNADICFSILEKKAPHILRIQDVSAINRLYMKDIYEKDMKQSPQFAEQLMSERGFLFKKKNQKCWLREIELSNYFIVPSEIVSKSLIFSGVKQWQIFKCPYGTYFEAHRKEYIPKASIEILYVGNVTQMKGIFYLLEAMESLPDDRYHLTVVGKYDDSLDIFNKYKKRVDFTGYVMHDEVKNYLKRSDIFVFPSLGDSFGLVVLEALSYGLPVLCSDHAGAADAIQDGKNGFIIPAGSSEAIIEKIVYCYEHPEFLKNASKMACLTAEKYTWQEYQKSIKLVIDKIKKNEVQN